MNFLAPVPLPSPESRQLHREMQLSLLAVLTGCALGFVLMVAVSLVTLFKPGPASRSHATSVFVSGR